MKIKLFVTGGTIDKQYNELTGKLDEESTATSKMLKQSRLRVAVDIEQLMLVDSLDMTENQRHQILDACRKTEAKRIVITHGTDTMVQTAELLGQSIQDKTVVLVGAMIPYEFGGSDALFNIGCAITAAQTLKAGVYITMNGNIFMWDNVVKNNELGEFQKKI
jgi:L-asparaginase